MKKWTDGAKEATLQRAGPAVSINMMAHRREEKDVIEVRGGRVSQMWKSPVHSRD